jgi:hypothetical protein
MSIPQLEFQYYPSNIAWSIFFFITFFTIYKIFLGPLYDRIQLKRQHLEQQQLLCHQIKNQDGVIANEIMAIEKSIINQEEQLDYLKNHKAQEILDEYNNQQDKIQRKAIKDQLLKVEDEEDLIKIIGAFDKNSPLSEKTTDDKDPI